MFLNVVCFYNCSLLNHPFKCLSKIYYKTSYPGGCFSLLKCRDALDKSKGIDILKGQ